MFKNVPIMPVYCMDQFLNGLDEFWCYLDEMHSYCQLKTKTIIEQTTRHTSETEFNVAWYAERHPNKKEFQLAAYGTNLSSWRVESIAG